MPIIKIDNMINEIIILDKLTFEKATAIFFGKKAVQKPSRGVIKILVIKPIKMPQKLVAPKVFSTSKNLSGLSNVIK